MKRIVALGCALAFALTLATVSGCGDPCEKTFNQVVKCEKLPKSLAKKMKKEFVEECSKDKDKKKVAKKCGGVSNCKKFRKCLRD